MPEHGKGPIGASGIPFSTTIMHFTDQVLTYRPHFSLHPRLTSCILAKKPEMSPHSALHTADRDAGVSTVHLPLVLGLPRWHLQKPTLLLQALLPLQVQPPTHFTPEFLEKRTTCERRRGATTTGRHIFLRLAPRLPQQLQPLAPPLSQTCA